MDGDGRISTAGYAPYPDYRPISPEELASVRSFLEADWLSADLEPRIVEHAVLKIVPRHLEEVRRSKDGHIEKTIAAVKDRLSKEINYSLWEGRWLFPRDFWTSWAAKTRGLSPELSPGTQNRSNG